MANGDLLEARLTESIIGAFYDVYNNLGYGFLEHVYVRALERELRARGHLVAREVAVVIRYKGEEIAEQRLDIIVDHKVLIEIKSTHDLNKSAARQVYNYLKATNLEVGVLFHFGPLPRFYRMIHRNNKKNPLLSVQSDASG